MNLLPDNFNNVNVTQIESTSYPTRSYLLNPYTHKLELSEDEHALMGQAIDIILAIERYSFPIFTTNVGFKRLDLPGMDLGVIICELESRLKSALMVDDRVINVTDFKYEQIDKKSIIYRFHVNTVYGNYSKELEIGL